MFGKRQRIASARALSLPATRGISARRVSPIVSAAVRVSNWRTQTAWLCVSLASIVALYFISKIEVKKADAPLPTTTTAVAPQPTTTFWLTKPTDFTKFIDLDFGRPHTPQAPETYGPEALAALIFPFAALVVAILFSLERKQRRLLREGLSLDAEVRELSSIATIPNTRTVECELVIPPLADGTERNVVAIRQPDAVGTIEPVLYDPLYPDRVLAVADLPGHPKIVDHTIKPTTFPVLHFVLPAAALALLVTIAISVPLALRPL